MTQTILVLVIVQLIGLAEILFSVPLLLNRVPQNRWYGWRTPKTLSSQEHWYTANRFFGKSVLVAGALLFTGCSFIWPLLPYMSHATVTIIGCVTTVVPLGIALWASWRHVRHLR